MCCVTKAESALLSTKDRQEFFAMHIARTAPGCVIDNIVWSGDTDDSPCVSISYSLHQPPINSEQSNTFILSLGSIGLPVTELGSRFALNSRGDDLLMRDVARNISKRIEINLSADLRIANPSKDMTLSAASVNYQRSLQLFGHRLVYQQNLSIGSERITNDEYTEVKKVIDTTVRDAAMDIVLKGS